MKYYQTSKFPKFVGSAGFFTLIALGLLGIGAASWFAVSRYSDVEKKPESSYSSYQEPTSSYNSSTPLQTEPEPEQNTSVAKPVSDVPYSSESSPAAPEKRSFVLPAAGNVLKGFSATALQYSATYGDMRLHTGIDITAAKGSEIKSAGKGKVTAVEDSSTMGKFISIDHGDGITVKYCGMQSVNVKPGESVAAGTVIGTVGEIPSECSDNSHIHIEALLNGKIVSPLEALGLN